MLRTNHASLALWAFEVAKSIDPLLWCPKIVKWTIELYPSEVDLMDFFNFAQECTCLPELLQPVIMKILTVSMNFPADFTFMSPTRTPSAWCFDQLQKHENRMDWSVVEPCLLGCVDTVGPIYHSILRGSVSITMIP